jgi:hypothetical protein
MQVLERANGRDDPSGGILEVVARQPYLLIRAGESAQEGHKVGVGSVSCRVPRDSVVGDAKASLVVRLVQTHVDPSTVLQVAFVVGFAGAFLQLVGFAGAFLQSQCFAITLKLCVRSTEGAAHERVRKRSANRPVY